MKNRRKELIHKAMDGNLKLITVMHQLTHYRCCDQFLLWLINNNIIGVNLEQWLNINFNNSIMKMIQYIIKVTENNTFMRPIIYEKDWI